LIGLGVEIENVVVLAVVVMVDDWKYCVQMEHDSFEMVVLEIDDVDHQ
jgi:hypothetical protein